MATESSQPAAHSLKCNKNRRKIMKTIQTQVPEQIYEKALDLVKQGWFRDEQDIFYEAIRRYLDSHRPDLMEKFIREDVEWGLHGND